MIKRIALRGVVNTGVSIYTFAMTKLTPEACRGGRGILKWSIRGLAEVANVTPNTVQAFENGRPIRQSTAEKIVAAFAAHHVEITNGDGTGARLLTTHVEPNE